MSDTANFQNESINKARSYLDVVSEFHGQVAKVADQDAGLCTPRISAPNCVCQAARQSPHVQRYEALIIIFVSSVIGAYYVLDPS